MLYGVLETAQRLNQIRRLWGAVVMVCTNLVIFLRDKLVRLDLPVNPVPHTIR